MIQKSWLFIFLVIAAAAQSIGSNEPVYAQVIIDGTGTTPCFLNYTAGYHMIEDCNPDGDYMKWALSGWQYITGGFFPMILVSLIIGLVYIHYKEAIYAIYIGMVFLPISFMFFPQVFVAWGILMAFSAIGILIWYAITKNVDK